MLRIKSVATIGGGFNGKGDGDLAWLAENLGARMDVEITVQGYLPKCSTRYLRQESSPTAVKKLCRPQVFLIVGLVSVPIAADPGRRSKLRSTR